MSDHYILDENKQVVKADALEWARWLEDSKEGRRVCYDVTDHGTVSTVFLGLDHAWGGGPPMIFETLVIGGEYDGEMERYSTWQQAEDGHAAMLKRVHRGFASHQSESGK